MPELQLRVEEITPATAFEYLGTGANSRQIRGQVVRRYASLMLSGGWNKDSPEPIMFDVEGGLVDGQHRLSAIVKAGEDPKCADDFAIRLPVMRGVAPDAHRFIDTGLSRNAADLLYSHGIGKSKTVAAISRLAILYQKDGIGGFQDYVKNPSNADVLDFATGDLELQSSAAFGEDPVMRGIVVTRISGLVHYITMGIDVEKGGAFMHGLHKGHDIGERNPISRLRNLYIANRNKRRQKLPATYLVAYAAKAWNAFISDREIKIFKIGAREDWPIFEDVAGE